jgi:hypothetical protein
VVPDPGSVYVDDPTITDDELIFRMIKSGNTKWDGTTAVRGATNAFQDRRPSELEELGVPAVAVSVYLGSEMLRLGTSPADLVERWGADYGVASISAANVRAQGQGIVRWPRPNNPEHGMVFALAGAHKSNGQSSKLAKASTIVIAPPFVQA